MSTAASTARSTAHSTAVQRLARRAGLAHPPQRAAHGRGPGPGLHRPGARRRRRAGGLLLPRPALPPGRPGMGGARPLPPLDRPLRHRALRGADRGGHPAGGRARDLWQRRQPPADVRHGRLHARHGDHRRLARPWARHRGRHGARAEAQELELLRLQPVLRRGARRGLDLGGGDVRRQLQARQPRSASSTSTTCRPTARRRAS